MKETALSEQTTEENRPIRIGLIGCGRRAQAHLEAILELEEKAEIKVLCDIDPGAVKRSRAYAPRAAHGNDPVTLLAQNPCDLVVISLAPASGRNAVREALLAAPELKAVLVEKPAALNAEQAEVAFEGLPVPVLVCHQMRLLPWSLNLKEWFVKQERDESWKFDLRCFGKLYDQGIHLLDMIYWLTGGLPATLEQSIVEDDPARLSAYAPLPADWRMDRTHPGPLWVDLECRMEDKSRVLLKAGPLAAEGWMAKCIRIEHEAGWLKFGTEGIETGGEFALEGLNWHRSRGEYEHATVSVYEGFYRWLNGMGDLPDLPSLEEHIEQLMWCEIVLRDPDNLRLPQPDYLKLPGLKQEAEKLVVIVPLSDHRGSAEACVRSWTMNQECRPEDFQLVLISNQETEAMADTLKPMLRNHDLWISTDQPPAEMGQGDMEEYVAGIDQTDAEWIFLSEPHCEATPECVREIRRFFSASEAAGFCTSCIDGYSSSWGKMEGLFYWKGFEEWRKVGHWAKMIMRGFGIRRAVYRRVGGFRLRYGRFGEWLLAADLHRGGWYIDYAPGVILVHHYSLHKPFLDGAIEEFVIGHARYLAEVPTHERLPYFPDSEIETTGSQDWKLVEKEARRSIPWLRKVFDVLKGGQESRSRKRRRRNRNAFMVGCLAWWSPRRALPYFIQYYEAQIELCMGKHLPRFKSERSQTALEPGDEWLAGQPQLADLPGFYGVEHWQGETFHWCRPLSGIYIKASGQSLILELDILDVLNKVGPDYAFLTFGRKPRVKINPDVENEGKKLRFYISAEEIEGETWLALISRPARRVRAEKRKLGLPVIAMRLIETQPFLESDPIESL